MDFGPAKHGTYVREVDPERFHRLSFAPPGAVRDMAWSIRFGFGDTDAPANVNRLLACLIDRQGKSRGAMGARNLPAGRAVISFSRTKLRGGEDFQVLQTGPGSGDIETAYPLASMERSEIRRYARHVENGASNRFESPNINELTLVRMKDEAAIVLNGVTLLHAPVDQEVEDLFCILQIEGTSVVIEKMVVRGIDP